MSEEEQEQLHDETIKKKLIGKHLLVQKGNYHTCFIIQSMTKSQNGYWYIFPQEQQVGFIFLKYHKVEELYNYNACLTEENGVTYSIIPSDKKCGIFDDDYEQLRDVISLFDSWFHDLPTHRSKMRYMILSQQDADDIYKFLFNIRNAFNIK